MRNLGISTGFPNLNNENCWNVIFSYGAKNSNLPLAQQFDHYQRNLSRNFPSFLLFVYVGVHPDAWLTPFKKLVLSKTTTVRSCATMTAFKRCQTCSRKIRSWNPVDIKRHLEICPTYFANVRSVKGQQIKCNLCTKILTDFRSAYHHLSITHFKGHFPRKLTRCITCKKDLKTRNHTVICKKYFHLVKEFSNR